MKTSIFTILLLISPFSLAQGIPKSEIELQTEYIGINIEKLEESVLKGDMSAIAIYLVLSLDGGGGEIFHEYDRPVMLRKIPDVRLAEVLGGFSTSKIQELGRELIHGLTPKELSATRIRMPKTFAIIKDATRTEQEEADRHPTAK